MRHVPRSACSLLALSLAFAGAGTAPSAAAAPRPETATGGASASTAASAASPADDPRSLRFAPLTVSFPRPETFRLKNGLVVSLLRDAELPIIDLALYLRGGT
ncbi:MAG TPA: hypothetical protein VFB95_02425, partial [Candidatus Cryosericum sp.]|nr:hypothetical protein [Candidatus Cryosericum sp.]